VQQLEHLGGADRVGDGARGRGVGEVAPRGDVGQQQVVLDEGDEHVDVLGRQPSRGASSATTAMPVTVWSPGRPLPMSCSSAPSSSRSGRCTRRVSAAAAAAASTRCRSTVKRW
jgi:hypothetical protein